ncbi:MAG: deoxyribodipyrimidine photo-lyase [Candidatus Izemoplasmatales bacterium]|jgi:deoxyribodipyrimidine photo-lyase|nr:deoxyribodipyrimidine photo-lyase [Candidatus Izemoplasmatales bacterium]
MDSDRIKHLLKSSQSKKAEYILYFLQQAQRYEYNHALAFAIEEANNYNLPLIVYFGFTGNYPEANLRHYTFMAEGLIELANKFELKGIHFEIIYDEPDKGIIPFLEKAKTVVMDIGYTKIQRQWRKNIYQEILLNHPQIDLYSVESDSIIPVVLVSDKEEYGAYTIRRKLYDFLPRFSSTLLIPTIQNKTMIFQKRHYDSVEELLKPININKSIPASFYYHGGYTEAKKWITAFISSKLIHYEQSNDPSKDLTSKMSMYLHFGQISSLEIYHLVKNSSVSEKIKDAFIEQLFVRRELAHNFVFYNPNYDEFESITTPWAYLTMINHQNDIKEYTYSKNDYIHFKTHDIYFNSAMKEMVYTGYMHNYMRMYWAKKIIEWSTSYKEAYEIIKDLNNTFFIDGRDALSYTGIAWCFGKHDRAWAERNIFGKIRYMNSSGLTRKFDILEYVRQMNLFEQTTTYHNETSV